MKTKHNMTYTSLCIYIILLILLPKDLPQLFGVIPIRITLTYLLFIVFCFDYYKNKIAVNNFNFKWIGIVYGIFLLLTIPSLFTTKNLFTSIYTIAKFISFFLVFYIVIKLKLTKEEYKSLVKIIIITSTIKFIWGLIEYIFEIDLFTVGAYKYPGAKGRVSAYFFNTIYYGMYINLIFGYLLYLINKSTNHKEKIVLSIVALLAFINIILTFTRSSFLVFFGIIFLLFVFLRKKIISKYIISLGIISIIVGIMIPGSGIFMLSSVNDVTKLVFKTSPLEKYLPMLGLGNADKDAEMGDYSLSHRKLFAKTAYEIGKDHMLTGVGFGSYINYIETDEFKTAYPEYKDVKTHPHTSVVLLFSEIGIPGLLAFITFIVGIITIIIKSIKTNKKDNQIAIIALVVTIGFCMVNIIAENAFYDTQIFPLYLAFIGLSINYTNYKNKVIIK